MSNQFFKGIPTIKYEGKDSKNPIAFKYYNAKQKVGKKTMAEHLRFAVAYWHTFCGTGGDPFGPGTKNYPWLQKADPVERALMRLLNSPRSSVFLSIASTIMTW